MGTLTKDEFQQNVDCMIDKRQYEQAKKLCEEYINIYPELSRVYLNEIERM